jgi:hypothetical protein
MLSLSHYLPWGDAFVYFVSGAAWFSLLGPVVCVLGQTESCYTCFVVIPWLLFLLTYGVILFAESVGRLRERLCCCCPCSCRGRRANTL